MKDLTKIREMLREQILEQISYAREMEDEEVREIVDTAILQNARQWGLSLKEKQELSKELFYAIRRLDILQELTDDPKVTEIMINGKDHIFIERNGRLYQWEKQFSSTEKLEDVIQQIVAKCNRTVNEASPIVDARLENGSRVNVVLAPIALNGPIVTIRRFPEKPITMEDLKRFGAISQEVIDFLRQLVIAGYNIFISGGTGSGKTTFLTALSNFIPKDEELSRSKIARNYRSWGYPTWCGWRPEMPMWKVVRRSPCGI